MWTQVYWIGPMKNMELVDFMDTEAFAALLEEMCIDDAEVYRHFI